MITKSKQKKFFLQIQIGKNRGEKFKEMTIQIMANSLRYAETHNIKNEEIVNL